MKEIDSDIISQCQRGDKTAFRYVVQTYQQRVFSLALKMIASEEDAKDIVQETFIRVWQNITGYDDRRPFFTWLYTIASRLCLDHLKSSHIKMSVASDEEVFRRYASDSNSQRMLENSEGVSIVKLLAEGLSEKQRLVFTLCQLERLTSQETEEITGMSPSQVKSNLYVARQIIRKKMKELGYE